MCSHENNSNKKKWMQIIMKSVKSSSFHHEEIHSNFKFTFSTFKYQMQSISPKNVLKMCFSAFQKCVCVWVIIK